MYVEQLPSAELSSHIECFWSKQISPTCHTPAIQPPQGTFELIFTKEALVFSAFNGQAFINQILPPGVWLIGQQTRCFFWQCDKKTEVWGARIKPFALFSCLNASPNELKNKVVELKELTRSPCANSSKLLEYLFDRHVEERLYFKTRLMLLERFIRDLFMDDFQVAKRVRSISNMIMRQRGNLKLADLCQQFEVSKVTLRNHFLSTIGILPKELSKLWRLNYCLLLQYQYPHYSLTDIGLLSGYYDQAHLIKEFKSVFPLTPSQLIKRDSLLEIDSVHQINRRLNAGYVPRTAS
ncbi:helix-turn-helix domain-containing protein [Alteromonas sediminis]|uniref:Helix-turn-helix domain-containing protein n=1 Tax=Alteromonas sediminis TaxID=2259342 RepID=A0A3N5Y2I1_9ALTE|nr:DUF6597 domain-containing transcriptional factor [Alteromonas sediminis]RPJ68097.1 helix-turn-helix domain-containing protein [Alteromonas sediminis]